jgi:hypothetical protein
MALPVAVPVAVPVAGPVRLVLPVYVPVLVALPVVLLVALLVALPVVLPVAFGLALVAALVRPVPVAAPMGPPEVVAVVAGRRLLVVRRGSRQVPLVVSALVSRLVRRLVNLVAVLGRRLVTLVVGVVSRVRGGVRRVDRAARTVRTDHAAVGRGWWCGEQVDGGVGRGRVIRAALGQDDAVVHDLVDRGGHRQPQVRVGGGRAGDESGGKSAGLDPAGSGLAAHRRHQHHGSDDGDDDECRQRPSAICAHGRVSPLRNIDD